MIKNCSRLLIVCVCFNLTSMLWAAPVSQDPPSQEESIPLWPTPPYTATSSHPPEQLSTHGAVSHVAVPRLIVYRPAHPNGTAVLVIAGGGYKRIERSKESMPAAHWLQAQGITTFELIYRLPTDWPASASFQDAQRAMRLIRAQAANYQVQSNHIGILGFSAGGHLAGMTAVTTVPLYKAVDVADQVSARPDFVGLIYPVITLMPPFDHTSTRRELIGDHPTRIQSQAYSVNLQIQDQMPPTFLAHAIDDPISPVDNSVLMLMSLRAHHIASELHVFQAGGHGWGLGQPDTLVAAWPTLFLAWLKHNGDLVRD
ncbi:alpha/beta hydrolase [Aquirhabdus sp.]|uniref:alpha/beta hydrolase n=1 Tax=Aquirhabdus sp. TaxID=2824160 RepID=UPI00396C8A9C